MLKHHHGWIVSVLLAVSFVNNIFLITNADCVTTATDRNNNHNYQIGDGAEYSSYNNNNNNNNILVDDLTQQQSCSISNYTSTEELESNVNPVAGNVNINKNNYENEEYKVNNDNKIAEGAKDNHQPIYMNSTYTSSSSSEIIEDHTTSATTTTATSTTTKLTIKCNDNNKECEKWASEGECEKNTKYMHRVCRKSCVRCFDDDDSSTSNIPSSSKRNRWNEKDQSVDEKKVYGIIYKTRDYMLNEVYSTKNRKKYNRDVRIGCMNRHELCSFWASIGECEKNQGYMQRNCAPACKSCHQLDISFRCPVDDIKLLPDDELAWNRPGDLNFMFERITTDPYYEQYQPMIHSRPGGSGSNGNDDDSSNSNNIHDGPWVITLENFLTDLECDRLIQLGANSGYERSFDVGKKLFDGTHDKFVSQGRTSTNAWCLDEECYNDPITKQILHKMENVTDIKEKHTEYLQLLRYEVGQKYVTHHDYISHQKKLPCGPRILTFFLYLNDVEAGGGTDFPRLGITIMPQKGKALLWPSVLNDKPYKMDVRTHHQALPVEEGIKYGANAWYHARDYKTPHAQSCT